MAQSVKLTDSTALETGTIYYSASDDVLLYTTIQLQLNVFSPSGTGSINIELLFAQVPTAEGVDFADPNSSEIITISGVGGRSFIREVKARYFKLKLSTTYTSVDVEYSVIYKKSSPHISQGTAGAFLASSTFSKPKLTGATTGQAIIPASAGGVELNSLHFYNNNVSTCFLKIYNLVTSDSNVVPNLIFPMNPHEHHTITFAKPVNFNTAISFRAAYEIETSADDTPLGAEDDFVCLNVVYVIYYL